jgi:tetratricopeptide (TPR) repeat protein
LGDLKLTYDWDWSGGESAFKRALELNPSAAVAYEIYSDHYLSPMKRHDEAIAAMKQALELDPLSVLFHNMLGWTLFWARQYDQAVEQFRKTAKIAPNQVWPYAGIAVVYANRGMYEEAIAESKKAVEVSGGWALAVVNLGDTYALAGKREEALKVLDELQERAKQEYMQSMYFAWVYMALGEKDQVFEWLQKAYEEHSNFLIHLNSDPVYDSLRSDPRFQELIRKVFGAAE